MTKEPRLPPGATNTCHIAAVPCCRPRGRAEALASGSVGTDGSPALASSRHAIPCMDPAPIQLPTPPYLTPPGTNESPQLRSRARPSTVAAARQGSPGMCTVRVCPRITPPNRGAPRSCACFRRGPLPAKGLRRVLSHLNLTRLIATDPSHRRPLPALFGLRPLHLRPKRPGFQPLAARQPARHNDPLLEGSRWEPRRPVQDPHNGSGS